MIDNHTCLFAFLLYNKDHVTCGSLMKAMHWPSHPGLIPAVNM